MQYKAVCWKELNIDRVVSGILWKNKELLGDIHSISIDYNYKVIDMYVSYGAGYSGGCSCVFSIPMLSDNYVVIQAVANRLSEVTGWEVV